MSAPRSEEKPLDEFINRASALLKKRLGHGELHRVELPRKGPIQLEWIDGAISRWFEWTGDDAMELLAIKDKKLPLLSRLADPDQARHLRILAWRPGRRVTLLDNSASHPRVLKGYRLKRFQLAHDRYEAARKALQGARLQCPEIIDVDPDEGSMMMVYHQGHRLGLSAENARLFRIAARALSKFQRSVPDDIFGTFEASDEIDVIGARLKRLERVQEEPEPSWHELFERLTSMSRQLPSPDYGFVHRDLHDKQFVVDGSQLVVLDFDLACAGDRLLDPGNFLAHLVLRELQGVMGATHQGIELCSERFLDGLKDTDAPGFWERLRFYQASTFCRLALIYRLRPRWRSLVPELTNIGHRCLDDLERISSRGNPT